MNSKEYRTTTAEVARSADLMRLSPSSGTQALDVGARDGHFSILLSERFDRVYALDLVKPKIDSDKVICVQGDATQLSYRDGEFDLVLCAEVLEHIPSKDLTVVCQELGRVSGKYLLIGVPYRQDIRVGRTTCGTCSGFNPPWGHVNTFDEDRLTELFPRLRMVEKSFVGSSSETTNWMSAWLMDIAGNPYGTYEQDESCIHCGLALQRPIERSFFSRSIAKISILLQGVCRGMDERRPKWIHVLFEKP
jgi:SAM-dependent methyltransferase